MAATKVIVAPDKDGGWTVDQPDPTPRITALATQRDAMARAREELRRLGGGEIEIRARDSPTLTLLEHTREERKAAFRGLTNESRVMQSPRSPRMR